MKKIIKKISNIVKFPKNTNKLERQVEAILFAASEPLDIETIEKRVQNTNNIKSAELLEKKIWSVWSEHPTNNKLTERLELGTELMQYGNCWKCSICWSLTIP